MYDVIVVGAGPAGSRFARQAATAGYDILLLEQGEVGRPLACSGHVSLDIWKFVPDWARDELFQNDIYGARFHLDGPGSRAYPFYREQPISNAIDRVGLDKILATEAVEAGAELREGYTVTGFTERQTTVSVTARGPSGVESFDGKLLAGADGPRSRIRTEAGLPDPEQLFHGVLGFDSTPDADNFVDVHLTVPGFFAWRIPRGDAGVEYGLAVQPGDDAPRRFENLCAGYDAEINERCSGMIPIGPPRRTVTTRVFLLGDAAGQTKPFTGGGILYGMRAADIAATVIDPDHPSTLQSYEHAWRAELGSDILLGRLIRAAYSVPRPIQRMGMRIFSGKIGVHMDRPTSLLSREQLRAMLSRK